MRHRFSCPVALFLVAAVFTPARVQAQPWLEALPAEKQTDFFEIQSAFRNWWAGRDHTEKGKGWKAFKRWEWFWEQRVTPDGRFPDPMQLFVESRKAAERRARTPELLGGSWTSLGPSQSTGGYAGLGRLNCVRVLPSNPSLLWAGSAGGGLWRSTDGGSTWSTTTDELPTLGVTDIAIDPLNPSVMYIATGDGDAGDTYSVGVLKSTDGGTTWNTTGLNWTVNQTRRISRLLMHPANSQFLVAAASNGIHKTTNGGVSWTQVSTTSNFRDMEFKPATPSVLYASRSSGQVFRSTNSGDSWTLLSSGIPTSGGRVALGVSPANAEMVYALYASSSTSGFSALYRSTDGGTTWSLRSSTPNILGWEADGSDTGGQGWYDLAIAVSQTNADHLFTGGVNNWKSTDGGSTWSIISMWYSGGGLPAVHADQHDLFIVPGTATMYAANDGGLYRTTNSGSSWAWLGTGLKITQFYKIGVAQTNPAVVIAGAQDNGTKALGTTGWRDVIGGDGMECAVDYTNASIMYGTLYYGDIFRSTNGGLSFANITGAITENGAWVTPFQLHPSSPSTIIAGYMNVWKTTNSGATWGTISSGFTSGTLDVVAIAPSNPDIIYVTNGSAIYRTTDGGASGWPSVSTPTSSFITAMEVHPSDPNTAWLTASGYTAGAKVFRTTNGGASWTNISGSLPNVPANTIVVEKNTADRLYVGTDIGVYSRDNTQSDWQDFSGGLPNVVVSELEIQYASKKIRAGTYGRGLWESPLATSPAPLCRVSADSFGVRLAPGGITAFDLVIRNDGDAPLTWSASTSVPSWTSFFPSNGSVPPAGQQTVLLTLRAVGGDGTVQIGSLTIASNDGVTGPLTVALRVEVEIPDQVLTVPVGQGWNLVSVPLRVDDYTRSVLFPGSVSSAYAYVPGGGYASRSTLSPREGYWLKFSAGSSVTFTGQPVVADTIPVQGGWNLVGAVSLPVHADGIGASGADILSRFFSFGPGGFAESDSLRPGGGYWVKMSGAGSLLIPGPGPAVAVPPPSGGTRAR